MLALFYRTVWVRRLGRHGHWEQAFTDTGGVAEIADAKANKNG